MYVYDTYIPIDRVSRIVYFICAITFSVEYVVRFIVAKNRIKYVFWDWSVIDAITIVFGIVNFKYQSELSSKL